MSTAGKLKKHQNHLTYVGKLIQNVIVQYYFQINIKISRSVRITHAGLVGLGWDWVVAGQG